MSEYVIVGGGIYGCAVALALAEAGAEVTLLEADTVACGASSGPGKRGVRANGRDPRELALMPRAYELWDGLDERLSADTGFVRTGHLLLVEHEADLAPADARTRLQHRLGIECRLVETGELHELEPELSHDVHAAVLCPNDGVADHGATTRAYAAAARRAGAELREHARVTGVETRGSRVVALHVDGDDTVAVDGNLLLLCNRRVPSLVLGLCGFDVPVWPVLLQVLLTPPLHPEPIRHLIGHASRTLAMKMLPDSRLMISGGWQGSPDPHDGHGRALPEHVEGNLAEARAVIPALDDVGVERAEATCWETWSIDGVPIIDHAPGVDNAWFATGWTGHGWAIAPIVAELLADWVRSGRRPAALAPFGLARMTTTG